MKKLLAIACCMFAISVCALVGCQHVDTGCAVIDVANHACQTLRYRERDGTVRSVQITNDDAVQMGRAAIARSDAGADGAP